MPPSIPFRRTLLGRLPPSLLTLLAALLVTVASAAREPLSVAILLEPGQEATTHHLTEQLRTLGFEVVHLGVETLSPHDRMELASQDPSRVAVLKPRAADGGIELWIVRGQGEAQLAEVLIPPKAQDDYRHTAAMRAVENLRAHLVRLGVLPSPEPTPEPAKPSPPPAEANASPQPEKPTRSKSAVWAGVGGAAMWSRGGAGTSGHLVPALQWDFARSFSVRASGHVPVIDAEVSGPEGTATVEPILALATLVLRGAPDSTLSPELLAGVGAARVETDGTPLAGFAGKREGTTAFFPHAGVDVRIALADSWAVRAGGLIGTAAPTTKVMFGDRKAATWGGVVLSGGLSLAARVY